MSDRELATDVAFVFRRDGRQWTITVSGLTPQEIDFEAEHIKHTLADAGTLVYAFPHGKINEEVIATLEASIG